MMKENLQIYPEWLRFVEKKVLRESSFLSKARPVPVFICKVWWLIGEQSFCDDVNIMCDKDHISHRIVYCLCSGHDKERRQQRWTPAVQACCFSLCWRPCVSCRSSRSCCLSFNGGVETNNETAASQWTIPSLLDFTYDPITARLTRWIERIIKDGEKNSLQSFLYSEIYFCPFQIIKNIRFSFFTAFLFKLTLLFHRAWNNLP